jgi:hypothetical protein
MPGRAPEAAVVERPGPAAPARPRHAHPDDEQRPVRAATELPVRAATVLPPDVPAPAPDVPPLAATGAVTPTTAGRPAATRPSKPLVRQSGLMGQPGVVDAEVIDEARDLVVTGGGRPVVAGAVAAEMVSALTEVAFREARADEWVVAEPGLPDVPASTALEPVRTGPRVLEADSWDTSVQPLVDQHYQGRRRAGAGSARLWIVIGLVVAALAAAITVPFLLTSGSGTPTTDRTAGGALPPGIDGNKDISGTSGPGATPSPTVTGIPAVAGASPGVTATADPASPVPSAPASGSTSTAPPAGFAPITMEAEAGGSKTSWGGTAARSSLAGASGGVVIDRVGEHWSGSTTDGYVDFRNIVVTDGGSYTVTIYYVYLAAGVDNPRRLTITANGSGAQSQSFSATSTVATRVVTVNLQGGIANTIRLTHDDVQSPAIDKIVISKP